MKGIATAILFIVLLALPVHAKNKKKKWIQVIEKISHLDEKVVQLEKSIAALSKQITEKLAEKLDSLQAQPATAEDKMCPEGWSKFQQSCYIFVDDEMSWNEAKQNCLNLGGYLAEVNSKAENEYLFIWMSNFGESWIGPFLGGEDEQVESDWHWGHTGEKMTYINWNQGEPNGGPAENCMSFRSYTISGWADVPCDNFPGQSICERQIE